MHKKKRSVLRSVFMLLILFLIVMTPSSLNLYPPFCQGYTAAQTPICNSFLVAFIHNHTYRQIVPGRSKARGSYHKYMCRFGNHSTFGQTINTNHEKNFNIISVSIHDGDAGTD
jgi:hypothetical protein